jgi:tetratricopeptide (TPR) repeat protein
MFRIYCFVLLFVLSFSVAAQEKGFSHAEQLLLQKILRGDTTVLQELSLKRNIEPQKPSLAYLEHYALFIRLLAFESGEDYYRLIEGYDNRIRTVRQHPVTIWTCIFSVDMCLHMGLVEMNQGNKASAMRSFYKAFLFYRENEKRFPNHKLNMKHQGVFAILSHQVPDDFRWLASMIGMNKNQSDGLALIQSYSNHVRHIPGLYEDALLYSGFSQLKFSETAESFVYDYFNNEAVKHSFPLMFVAGMLGFKVRKNDCVLKVLDAKDFNAFPLLWYVRGRSRLNKGEVGAINDFERYLEAYKGNSYRADALLRRSWTSLLNDDRIAYQKWNLSIAQLKSYPTSGDRQAFSESHYKSVPIGQLLKSRLLFDGGYYELALDELKAFERSKSINKEANGEFFYRMGRIYHETGRYEEAEGCYIRVIGLGNESKRYFAPYSAIMAAKICLQREEKFRGLRYLESAEKLNAGEYQPEVNREIKQLKKSFEQL